MSPRALTPAMLDLVAERFRALAQPARLQIMQCLRGGERTVTEIVDETGLGQANVSKHLRLLDTLGFVSRRKDGLFACYSLADHNVFQLCDIMCGRVAADARARSKLVSR
jgi:DNA-binding transcriptional ArsR family regulator